MNQPPIACPHCTKAYRWTSQLAGRKVRCVCGQKFRAPMTPGNPAAPLGPPPPATPDSADPSPPIQIVDDQPDSPTNPIELLDDPAHPAPPATKPPATPTTPDWPAPVDPPDDEAEDDSDVGYELDLPDELAGAAADDAKTQATLRKVRPANGKCPSCNTPLRPQAVICLNCGFNLLEGAKIQTRVNDPEPATTADSGKPAARRGSKAKGSSAPPSPPSPDASGSSPDLTDRLRRSAERAAYDQQVAEQTQQRFQRQENTVPLIVAAAGLLVMLFNALVIAPQFEETLLALTVMRFAPEASMTVETFIKSAVQLALQVPCLLAGLFVIAALFGSNFGTLTSALKKLIALALLCGQIDLALYDGFNLMLNGLGGIAWMLQAAVSFSVFWLVSRLMFDDLEVGETIGLWFAVGMIPSGLIFLYFLVTPG